MNLDKDGLAINGLETTRTILHFLDRCDPVLLSWTDGEGARFDILIVRGSQYVQPAGFQGGIRGDETFVSILRLGAWGFKCSGAKILAPYVIDKLGVRSPYTATMLADLLNSFVGRV